MKRAISSSARLPACLLALSLLLSLALPRTALPQAVSVQTGWRLPPEAQRIDLGRELKSGDLSLRLCGFVSALPPQRLAESFAQSLGEPLARTALPGGRGIVLGRPQPDGYLTVQITEAGSGARGIVALASMAHETPGGGAAADVRRWLERLPAGTQMLSDKSSRDAGRLWRQRVLANAAIPEINRNVLEHVMREYGLRLRHASKTRDGEALLFTAPGREAVAAILRRADGSSTIVLDTIDNIDNMDSIDPSAWSNAGNEIGMVRAIRRQGSER